MYLPTVFNAIREGDEILHTRSRAPCERANLHELDPARGALNHSQWYYIVFMAANDRGIVSVPRGST